MDGWACYITCLTGNITYTKRQIQEIQSIIQREANKLPPSVSIRNATILQRADNTIGDTAKIGRKILNINRTSGITRELVEMGVQSGPKVSLL